MPPEKPPVPQFPGGPDPTQPVPRTPVDGVDLATYASLSIRMADKPDARAEILSGAGLDESRWMQIEMTWLLRVATAALQEDLDLARELDEASVAEQDRLCEDQPTWPMEAYAALTAQIESGYPVAQVLANARLTMAGFAHQQRAWAPELAKDPDAASAFRGHVEAWKRQWGKPGS